MADNRKKRKEVRQKIIRVRVNEIEWNQLQENSGASKVSPFLRDLGLRNATRKDSAPKADPELIRQLVRIGNNVNQLTKTANEYRKRGEYIEAVEMLGRLKSIESELEAIRQANQKPDGSGGA